MKFSDPLNDGCVGALQIGDQDRSRSLNHLVCFLVFFGVFVCISNLQNECLIVFVVFVSLFGKY